MTEQAIHTGIPETAYSLAPNADRFKFHSALENPARALMHKEIALFKFSFQDRFGREIEASIESQPGRIDESDLIDIAHLKFITEDGSQSFNVAHKPIDGNLRVITSVGETYYVGSPISITIIFAMACRALEDGIALSAVGEALDETVSNSKPEPRNESMYGDWARGLGKEFSARLSSKRYL